MLIGWLQKQVTWRNLVRACGLAGMMWLVLTESHPDPTALIAMGTMIGLPTFFWLDPYNSNQHQPPPDEQHSPPPPHHPQQRRQQ